MASRPCLVVGVALDCDGTPLPAPDNGFCFTSINEWNFSDQFDDRSVETFKDAKGRICEKSTEDQQYVDTDIEATICDPCPEILPLMFGLENLTDGTDTVGFAHPTAASCDCGTCFTGAAIMLIAENRSCAADTITCPYEGIFYPGVRLYPGDRTRSTTPEGFAITGYTYENPNFPATSPWPEITFPAEFDPAVHINGFTMCIEELPAPCDTTCIDCQQHSLTIPGGVSLKPPPSSLKKSDDSDK